MSTKPLIRTSSVEIVSFTPAPLSTRPANVEPAKAAPQAPKKRKSLGDTGSETAPKRAKASNSNKAVASAPPEDPAQRWKWINLCKPEMEFKGTKIEVFNCGGTFFKVTAKTLEMRLDKLEMFYNQCNGDETRHANYGYPERCKPTVKARKDEGDRWNWLNKCRPEIRLKGSSIEAYNCGGRFFSASGKTLEDRLDKIEKHLAECDGDETAHSSYGRY
ncbi:hypothetical protein GGX14DRAFT_587226 [Mycena pura]|uniref:Uncharacterized protein n=1 Tax=Mycena pura TaxID=153505 RepID=A0AAD6UUI2_9AGAR|nr:hypothetical protein GGX14DRAFT_587226 [Mycena pura]